LKTKIGTEVAHVTRRGHHFQGQKVKGQGHRGGGILWRPRSRLQLVPSAERLSILQSVRDLNIVYFCIATCPRRLTCRGQCPAVLQLCKRYAASVVPSVSQFCSFSRHLVCALWRGKPHRNLSTLAGSSAVSKSYSRTAAVRLVCNCRKYGRISPLLRDICTGCAF